MKRIVTNLLILLALSLGCATWLMAQNLSADRFLEGVSAHHVGDEAEQAQSSKVSEALNLASPAEVEKVLPTVLQYTRNGSDIHARRYAIMFLVAIAIRPDGAALLSSGSREISSLIVDDDPWIQKVAVSVTDYVIARPATNRQPYVAALEAAIQKTQTPQEVTVGMVGPLLYARFFDSNATKSVLDFMRRDDLTADTRRELVHTLGVVDGLPEELTQLLLKELADPDPTVRATALVAYADSTTAFHTLGKPLVEKMANDPQEHPQVRELAKEAISGKTALNPNINTQPDKPKDQ